MSRALLEQLKDFLCAGSEQAGKYTNPIADLVSSMDGYLATIDADTGSINTKLTTTNSRLLDISTRIEQIKDQSLSRGVTNFGGKCNVNGGVTTAGTVTLNFAPPPARLRHLILSLDENPAADTWWTVNLDGTEVWRGNFVTSAPVPYILRFGEFWPHTAASQMVITRMTGAVELYFSVHWETLIDDSASYRTTQADT